VVKGRLPAAVGQGEAGDVTADGDGEVTDADWDGEGVLAVELPQAATVTVTSSAAAHLI
jgi:hypothetical protein